jgi:hypothetical protein
MSPVITVEIKGKRYEALLDSGSSVCIIQANVIQDTGLQMYVTPSKHNNITTVSGENVPVLGQIQIPIKTGNTSVEVTFLVLPQSPKPLLLGIDFMTNAKIVLDFARKKHFLCPFSQAIFSYENCHSSSQ